MSRKTLVLGASQKIDRYSNKAVRLLRSYRHEVVAVGAEKGQIEDVPVLTEFPEDETVDTVTMYLNPALQESYYEKILALKPGRIIFNPGTENASLSALAKQQGIETENACTLVLLNTGQY